MGAGYNETEAYLSRILSPDQARQEGLDEADEPTAVLCADGVCRALELPRARRPIPASPPAVQTAPSKITRSREEIKRLLDAGQSHMLTPAELATVGV